jgi:pyrimidine-nucleoside phosphorylase
MNMVSLIEKKRDGGVLAPGDIAWMIGEFTAGRIPDYQMSALAMAVYFRGLDEAETLALTLAMRQSGRTLSWPAGHPPVVDKHSTGGIGDKTSLLVAPLLACDGLWVPMICGRGLGITGGTLDKLESIPGFRVGLSPEETVEQVCRLGVAMVGPTPEICPADAKLYALRDVTATVPSQSMIVASIMSKKLAAGLDRLSLDVKFGSGAFMKSRDAAQSLAEGLIRVGQQLGVATLARLTPMSEPLGCAVGNALEVSECIDALQGGGPPDMVALALDLCEPVACSPRHVLAGWLADGTAWTRFQAMVAAQGGDLEAFARRPEAPVIRDCRAPHGGTLTALDAGVLGQSAIELGAGRHRTSDPIDHRVGFDHIAKIGHHLNNGDIVLRVHAASHEAAEAALVSIASALRIE